MNLFLLIAVPLAAFGAQRWLYPDRSPLNDGRSLILGFVWSILALLAASCFGRWREFTGSLVAVFAGLTFTDVILVPGVVVAAWILTRPKARSEELALWLTLVFTMAGIRDFISTRSSFDLNELFLVPLDRILLILCLPGLVVRAIEATVPTVRGSWITVAGAFAVSGALFPVLSFAGWGGLVWVLLIAGIALALLLKKQTASWQSGLLSKFATVAVRLKRP